MKILIVEDTEDSRIILEMILVNEGYEVISSKNGSQALNLAHQTPPDLIISDIMMPKMDGFELCRQIKADPDLKHIPIIFYTATYTQQEDKELAKALGVARFVIKPCKSQALVAVIRQVLADSRSQKSPGPDHPDSNKQTHELVEMHLHSVGKKLDKKVRELLCEREALKKSEQKYRHLVESIQNYSFFYERDTQGAFTAISPSVEFVLGYKADEFLADYTTYFTRHSVNQAIAHHTKRGIQGEEQPPYEIEILARDGSVKWLELKEAPILDQGGRVSHIEGIALNITGRKLAEIEREKLKEQLNHSQKMESIGRLAGGVAHDFNNMLSVILGYADLALSQVDSDQRLYSHLREIRNAADRSANLTRQLLAFARQQSVTPKVIALNEVVEGLLRMLGRLIGEDIELTWTPGPNLWPIKVDPSQIDQILANLCVNARDAIAGVGKIGIATENIVVDEAFRRADPHFIPGNYVRLTVADDGCGMSKQTLDNLFDPFFTTKEIGKGTGLGLATVYGIVRQNDGFITIHSEPGQGSIFKIYLPQHQGCVELACKPDFVETDMRGSETILLVEDEQAVRQIIKIMLESLGYKVISASRPTEAIGLAHGHTDRIHLLLTDVVMPEMNGWALTQKLLHDHPDLKCLFMSGYSPNVNALQEVLNVSVHFIQKPFVKQNLADSVRGVLDNTNE